MPFNSKTGTKAGQKSSRAGVPNKDTCRREWISDFLNKYFNGKLKEDFDSLAPGERVKAALKLLEFDTPRLQSTTLSNDFEKLTEEQLDQIISRMPGIDMSQWR